MKALYTLAFLLWPFTVFGQEIYFYDLFEKGKLIDGNKVGKWSYYDQPGELSLEVDHTKGELLYVKPDSSFYTIRIEDGQPWEEKVLNSPCRYVGSQRTLFNRYEKAFFAHAGTSTVTDPVGESILQFEVNHDGSVKNAAFIKDELKMNRRQFIQKHFNEIPTLWLPGVYAQRTVDCRFAISFRICVDSCLTNHAPPSAKLLASFDRIVYRNVGGPRTVRSFLLLGNFQTILWATNDSTILITSAQGEFTRAQIFDLAGNVSKSLIFPMVYALNWKDNVLTIGARVTYSSQFIFHYDLETDNVTVVGDHFGYYPLPFDSGSKIAYMPDKRGFGQLYIYEKDSGRSQNVSGQGSTPKKTVLWSGDGRYLLYTEQNEELSSLVFYDTKEQKEKLLPYLNVEFLDWSPDYTKVLVKRTKKFEMGSQVILIDIATGESKEITPKLPLLGQASYGKEPQMIYYTTYNDLFMHDLHTGKSTKIMKHVHSYGLSNNKSKIAYINSRDGQLYVMEWDGTDNRKISTEDK